MTSIRIAIAAALAIAAVLAGGSGTAHHGTPAQATLASATSSKASPVPCCVE